MIKKIKQDDIKKIHEALTTLAKCIDFLEDPLVGTWAKENPQFQSREALIKKILDI